LGFLSMPLRGFASLSEGGGAKRRRESKETRV